MTKAPYIWTSGDKLWTEPRQCPHDNSNACATCDHDGYYVRKHGQICPWFSKDDE